MKKLFLVVLMALLSVSLFAVSYDQSVQETAVMVADVAGTKTTVAFVSMDSDSRSFASRFVSDVEEALMERDCIVLDRKNLETLVKELEFQTSGLVDDRMAVSIGHMAGAQLIIVGSSVNNTSSYRVEVSLLDVGTSLTKRRKSFDLSYDQKLRNIVKGNTSNVGNQSASVGFRVGVAMQMNKAHEDMVGTDVRPLEESPVIAVPTLVASYKLTDTLKLQLEGSFIKNNGITIKDYAYEVEGIPMVMDIDTSYSSIDVPVLLSWNFIQDPVSVDVFAGAYASIPTSTANINIFYHGPNVTHGGAIDIKGIIPGVTAGFDVGFDFGPGRLVLDARFCYDLKNSMAYSDEVLGGEQGLIYRRYLGVSAGYSFAI